MLKTIIAKEIRTNILSFRFLASFALLFVIVTVTSLVLTGDYLRRQDEYSQQQAELEHYLRNYAHFNRIGPILQATQPPIPFQTLVRGLTAEVNLEQFDDDPLPVIFPLIDLTFIVTILVSLMALILSYDAVCGEKEDGTLKLMLANGLSRSKIILGKFAGGMLTLLGPFLLSVTAAMLIILLHPRVSWTGADWGALGPILLGAALYIAVFYLIGIL
ncbi:MAG: ABC transporter permease subunit, partial [Acidobacteria bacterium]|nr:ABC transporter permease subunit [Acidobacteriota bacterium]